MKEERTRGEIVSLTSTTDERGRSSETERETNLESHLVSDLEGSEVGSEFSGLWIEGGREEKVSFGCKVGR